MVLDRKQGWRSWRSQDLRLRLVGAVHGCEAGRRLVRPEFTIWPSGAWPLLPPAKLAQAQELARKRRLSRPLATVGPPPLECPAAHLGRSALSLRIVLIFVSGCPPARCRRRDKVPRNRRLIRNTM